MPLDAWTIEEYERQWKEGFERIRVYSISCLVASIQQLKNESCIDMWVLYKEGDEIYIQNQVLFGDYLEELSKEFPAFDRDTCYQYIKPRETISEEGNEISEWSISLK